MHVKAAAVFAILMACTYLGYPLVAFLLSRLRPRPVAKGLIEPLVTVVLPVFNEGQRLQAKIANILSQDYPSERLQLVVADDGSTDGSVECLKPSPTPMVTIVSLPARRGKAAALNAAVPLATGDIVVFTDARQDLAPHALRRLVTNFADPSVTAVSGRLETSASSADGLFRKYEETLRQWEAAWGSCAGATGALYAIRRCAWRPVPEDAILDDLFISLSAASRGRLVYEREAVAIDSGDDSARCWKRRLRTLAGNWQMLLHARQFSGAFSPSTLLQLICHKVLRVLFPFFAAGLLFSLLWEGGTLLAPALVAAACGVLVLAACPEARCRSRLSGIAAGLFVAPVEALVRYALGRETARWDRHPPRLPAQP